MKKTIYIAAVVIFALSCKEKEVTTTQEVQEVETVTEAPAKYSVLFDGSSFDAWKGYGTDGMHDNWTIEDGAMAFTPGEEGGKNIITKNTYKTINLLQKNTFIK